MNLSDESHLETCRGKNCHLVAKRSEMIRAAKVLNRTARGYYCDECGRRLMRFQGRL